MKILELLLEQPKSDIASMKSDIIGKIKKTDDTNLVQKIYTVLNKTGLEGRISPVLARDTDTKGYVEQLVNIIIDTPGTYEEKTAFIDQYPNGYINISKMLSGELVSFDTLITGGPGAPLAFVHRVFDALKQVTFGTSKGPGEFGLAVLSPHIKITGKGDLNIDNDIIEVKANAGKSGGRLGTPGLLRVDEIVTYLNEFMPEVEFAPGQGLNLKQLSALMNEQGLNQSQQTNLANKLFKYIFKNKADISGIVRAVVNGEDPSSYYLKANYELYQAESGFTGMMLMNFQTQQCKYFKDPLQMAQEIYAFSIYLISSTPGFESRQILSQVTLRPVKESTSAPKTTVKKSATKVAQPEPVPAAKNKPAPRIRNQTKPAAGNKEIMGQDPDNTPT